VLEQFWPVGEPAANCRALISGTYSYKDERVAKKMMTMLDGTYCPKEPDKHADQQALDQIFKNFFNQP